MGTTRKDFDDLGVVERPIVQKVEMAIANSQTFMVLIGQSGNHAAACARDIARDVVKELGL